MIYLKDVVVPYLLKMIGVDANYFARYETRGQACFTKQDEFIEM